MQKDRQSSCRSEHSFARIPPLVPADGQRNPRLLSKIAMSGSRNNCSEGPLFVRSCLGGTRRLPSAHKTEGTHSGVLPSGSLLGVDRQMRHLIPRNWWQGMVPGGKRATYRYREDWPLGSPEWGWSADFFRVLCSQLNGLVYGSKYKSDIDRPGETICQRGFKGHLPGPHGPSHVHKLLEYYQRCDNSKLVMEMGEEVRDGLSWGPLPYAGRMIEKKLIKWTRHGNNGDKKTENFTFVL